MARNNCGAIAGSTGQACSKPTLPGSRYCWHHIEKKQALILSIAGSALGVAIGWLIPSAELVELRAFHEDAKPVIDLAEELLPDTPLGDAFRRLPEFVEQQRLDLEAAKQETADLKKETDALKEESKKQKEQAAAAEGWTDVALVDWDGTRRLGGMGTSTNFGGRFAKSVHVTREVTPGRDKVKIDCEPDDLAAYREAIAHEPRFPFPFFFLAFCQRRDGSDEWRANAEVARMILDQTTKVPGRSPSHSSFLTMTEALLSGALRPKPLSKN